MLTLHQAEQEADRRRTASIGRRPEALHPRHRIPVSVSIYRPEPRRRRSSALVAVVLAATVAWRFLR